MTATAEASTAAQEARHGRTELVARHLVELGKVVPTLVVGADDTAWSRWLPLPGMGERDLLAGLLDGDTADDHRVAAEALAAAVDTVARGRLTDASVALLPRRAGRRTVIHAWLESLASPDPTLPAYLPLDKIRALAAVLDEWVDSGAVALGRGRLCLRVHEPGTHPDAPLAEGRRTRATTDDPWWVELLLQDADEPSLVVPIGELWAGDAPFPAGSVEDLLRTLARTVAVAPELAGLLEGATPTGVALDTDTLLHFVDSRLDPLAEAGVSVLLPSWWRSGRRLALRARARTPGSAPKGVVTNAGLGFDRLVQFTWEAALGDQRLTKADLRNLERAAEAKKPLVQLRGEWVRIDGTGLRAVLDRVGTGGTTSVGGLLRASLGLPTGDDATDGVDDGADGLGDGAADVVATGWLGRLLHDVAEQAVRPLPTPSGFDGELRPYQQLGAGWLGFLGRLGLGACLADDMGLGKTAQLIATVLDDRPPVPVVPPRGKKGAKRATEALVPTGATLVVCPVSVLGNWERELARFAPSLRVVVHHGRDRHDDDGRPFVVRAEVADVVLTTYSLVARDAEHLGALRWHRVVLDEAQHVKNPGTRTARAVRGLSAERRVALTGTPVENRLAELWSIMQFLNPGLLGSLSSFTDTFARPIERDGDDAATETLQRLVSPFLLRRLKTDKTIIGDLPDKIEQTRRCPLTREQASLYQAVVDDLLSAAEREEGIARSGAVLAGIAKLKQVCNHPAHFLGDGSELPGRSGKLEAVEDLLDDIVDAGDRVLCFTQFAEWGSMLVPHLARRYGTEPLWLHGGVPRKRREDLLVRFADPDGPPIFLLSLKAGGTGLNLTAANHVIHLDRWWNPAVEDQATDRAYRIGQRRSVLVHKLVTTGTIEERIDEMITEKRALAQRVVGTGEDWITKLDTAGLRDVVALRDTEVV